MRTWIEKRIGDGGALSYRVRYRTPDGAVRSETVRQLPGEDPRKTHDRARQRLAELRTDVARGAWVAPADLTLADLIERYLAARAGDLAPSTLRRLASAAKHVPPALAAAKIDQVDGFAIQGVYGRLLASGMSGGGVLHLHKLFSGAFRRAVAQGLLARNPLAGVDPPKERKRPPSVWTEPQVARFLAAEDGADPPDPVRAALWRFLLLTGCRVGEAQALTWADLDLERGTATIRRTATEDADGKLAIGTTTKKPRSRRTVALSRSVVASLREHRRRQAARRLAADRWIDREPGTGALVFDRGDGGLAARGPIRVAFRRACARQGLPPIRLHDCRHTNATNDLAAGTPPKVVADRLGITVEILLQTYGHALPEMHRAAVDAMEARLAAAIGHDNTGAEHAS